jgi:hypothetical protein
MRKEWRSKGFRAGAAYLGEPSQGVCPNCGETSVVFGNVECCGPCVWSSLDYADRHGIGDECLADEFTDGRIYDRIGYELRVGFRSGVAVMETLGKVKVGA